MKMNKLLLLVTIIITTHLCLFGQSKDWNVLNKNGYSIQYPTNWELDESGQMGTSFILFSPLISQKDQFKENVNLLIQDLTGYNLNLEKYVKISEDQIKTMMEDSKIIESKRIKSQTSDYQKLIYTGKQGILNLKFEQYYWVIGDKAFVLTLTCEETQFDNYQVIGEKILNSFRFNKN